jgi:alkanesulfonate monooxygenase SsuD/methylene tetrahydromethanopterin reductase-like flavin-dependent oxidoreductase (luciferase family)
MFNKIPILECWTTLSALSAATKKIRLGTMVTCNSFRNPALLAKMAATLDNISNGRLELGIGAGVQKSEHDAYGFSFPSPRVRIERLNEAVELIKKMWTEDTTHYNGTYYNILDAACEPKPIQKPHPPIVVCGAGEKLTLKVTARHADRYDWSYLPSFEEYERKLKILEKHCKKVGRSLDDIEKSCWPAGQTFIGDTKKELKKKVMNLLPKGASLEEFMQTNFVGSADDYLQSIQKYIELGVTYFMVFFGDLPELKGLNFFSEKVVNMLG